MPLMSDILTELANTTQLNIADAFVNTKELKDAAKDVILALKGNETLSEEAQDYAKLFLKAKNAKKSLPLPPDMEEVSDEEEIPNDGGEALHPSINVRAKIITYTVDAILKQLENKTLKLPTFQTKMRWKIEQQKAFIENFMRGTPLTSVFVGVDAETGNRFLLDGMQRTGAMLAFIRDQVPLKELLFSQLPPSLQTRFINKEIFVTEVESDPDDFPEIFQHINHGGVPLNFMEIVRAVFRIPFLSALEALDEKHDKWHELFGKDNRYRGPRCSAPCRCYV